MDSVIQNLAPYISKIISENKLKILLELRTEIDKQITILEYTNHTTKHSDNILRIGDEIFSSRKIDLNETETFIFISVCYLHNIMILSRRNIRSNLKIDDHNLSIDMLRVISYIHNNHNNITAIKEMKQNIELNGTNIRLKLITAIFTLAENLDIGHKGSQRIPQSVFKLIDRLYWYRNHSITRFEINKNIILFFENPLNLKDKELNETIIEPIIKYIKIILDVTNEVLSENNYPVFILDIKYEDITNRREDIDESELNIEKLLKLAIDIKERTIGRKQRIDGKLKKQGLIRKGKINNELIILKRWSSYTPRMPFWNKSQGSVIPNPETSLGGGYFLVWNDVGIAIDPGYDFLRNFWTEKISSGYFEVEDIKTVLISHAHDDHTHDIEPIISLLYKRSKKNRTKFVLPLYCSEGVHIKYERLFSINKELINVIDLVPSNDKTESLSRNDDYLLPKGIDIEYIGSEHNEKPWMKTNTGVSMIFHLTSKQDKIDIGYTSDTKFNNKIVSFFSNVDLLILHFGNFGPDLNSTSVRYDESHLGITGCHDLIEALKNKRPRLFLIGEFGEEEIGNDRVQLCGLLESLIGVKDLGKSILPMDIGLRIKLPHMEVLCQEHDHFVPFQDIKPHLPKDRDNISYFCK